MLRPTKHSHPDRTIINVAYILLKRLKKRRIEKFDELLKFTKSSVKGGGTLFLSALNFLYVLGLVEYRRQTDSIEYVGSNETI
ncbi:MAG: hypothetical protein HQK88_07490 [Nitrospirae bacterium]|nr:hypothetical protein [Nitrospirota bacterium]